jgi:hypothetical protein
LENGSLMEALSVLSFFSMITEFIMQPETFLQMQLPNGYFLLSLSR